MKTTWVLTEEERKQKFEGRKKKRKSGSIDEEIVDDPLARVGISSQELEEVSSSMVLGQSFGDLQLNSKVEQYVRTSGHWDVSKVSDMNTSLIREFIRLDLFLKALDLDNSLTGWWLSNTASVLGARRSCDQ